jgi:alkanesulfonate monooxygenase SsuD/methylene tetrahydromethanopterin reductase-like flavin-dependent oxidoreductase (luciferase family)
VTADQDVEYGAHLPLVELGASRSLPALKAYTGAAAGLGYRYLCANDHLVFGRPWLDGPTALAALIEASADMTLVTTAGLPVVRGPVPLAKSLAALDILSGGRLVAGVGPGSSAGDYAAAGLAFEERWRRFDEALQVLRLLLHGGAGFEGEFYATNGVVLEPRPVQRPGPPIWVASWGSPAGLRRVARLGDGWLASAYNTTPERFREGLDRLAEELRRAGKAPERFPTAIATAWLHVTEDTAAAERTLGEVLAPMVHRPVEALRSASLLIGPAEVCAERLSAFVAAGARRIFVWPLGDEVRQLELFRERVTSL